MTDISIVIPSYQRVESLRIVLNALACQSLGMDRFEVIVSIDGSTDGTETMLAQLQMPYRLQWLTGPNSGSALARNRGAALAQGNILLFLDDDIIASRDLLLEHLNGQALDLLKVCLGQVRLWPECHLSDWEAYLNRWFETHYDKLDRGKNAPTYWDFLSGNVSLARELFDTYGGFSEVFAETRLRFPNVNELTMRPPPRHEDIELGYRLTQGGAHFVYHPKALGYHRFVKSVEMGLSDAFANGYSLIRLHRSIDDLTTNPLADRWLQYGGAERSFLRWCLRHPTRLTRVARLVRIVLRVVERHSLPLYLKGPIFRLAYHLHFWQGVAAETLDRSPNILLSLPV